MCYYLYSDLRGGETKLYELTKYHSGHKNTNICAASPRHRIQSPIVHNSKNCETVNSQCVGVDSNPTRELENYLDKWKRGAEEEASIHAEPATRVTQSIIKANTRCAKINNRCIEDYSQQELTEHLYSAAINPTATPLDSAAINPTAKPLDRISVSVPLGGSCFCGSHGGSFVGLHENKEVSIMFSFNPTPANHVEHPIKVIRNWKEITNGWDSWVCGVPGKCRLAGSRITAYGRWTGEPGVFEAYKIALGD